MMQGGTTEQIRGRVEQANDKGLKIDGRWFNFSQYSRSTVKPVEGDDVELEIARGKFINDAKILGSGGAAGPASDDRALGDGPGFDDDDPFALSSTPASAVAVARPPRAATNSRSGQGAWSSQSGQSATPNADRNTEIRRLALIKAAADYAAARQLEPEDVPTIAAQWEQWVTGEREPTNNPT